MKAIVEIGYNSFLVADVKTATKVVELLADAVQIDDRLYKNHLIIRRGQVSVSAKVVSDTVKITLQQADGDAADESTDDGIPVNVNKRGIARKANQLPFREQLLLEATTGEAR